MLLEAVAAAGISLEQPYERDSQLPPARALVEMLSLFSPEITVHEVVGRLRRVLKGVLDVEFVEVLLHDPEEGQLLIPSVLGNPDNRGHARTSSAGDLASTQAALSDPATIAMATAACAALGGRSSSDGYVRVPVAACGVLEYAVRKLEPVLSDDIRSDPRFVNSMPPSPVAAALAKERGLAIGCWSEQQRHVDMLLGLPDRSRSLAVSPVLDGDGCVLGVLLVANKMPGGCGAGGPSPTSSPKSSVTAGGCGAAHAAAAAAGSALASAAGLGGAASGSDEVEEEEEGDEARDGVGELPAVGSSRRGTTLAAAAGARGRSATGVGGLGSPSLAAAAAAAAAGSAASGGGFDGEDGHGRDGVRGRADHKNRRLTGLRTWTLLMEAAATRHAEEALAAALTPASPAAAGGGARSRASSASSAAAAAGGVGGGARSSASSLAAPAPAAAAAGVGAGAAAARPPSVAAGAGAAAAAEGSASGTRASPDGSGSKAAPSSASSRPASSCSLRRETMYAEAPVGSFTPRDEEIVAGLSEALAMALDDRRVELETIISSRNFTPLVDIPDYFRVQLNTVIHVPLPGSKPGSALPPTPTHAGSAAAAAAAAAAPGGAGSVTSTHNMLHPVARMQAAKAAASDAEVPRVAVTSKVVGQVTVTATVYHGSQPLGETRSEPAPLQGEVDRVAGCAAWNSHMALLMRYCNLPLAARVIFNVTYRDGSPVGWAGCNVFTAQQVLRSGTLVLPLWPGRLTPENILRITNLANTTAPPHSVPSLVVTLHTFDKTVVRLGPSSHLLVSRNFERPAHPGGAPLQDTEGVPAADYLAMRAGAGEYGGLRERVGRLVRQDPLHRLDGDEAALLWRCREYLTTVPEALPKFLQSVRWDDAPSVEEAHRLLLLWRPPSPMQALELLQADFADPTVRCVVACLRERLCSAVVPAL
jgi:hypothetical protein